MLVEADFLVKPYKLKIYQNKHNKTFLGGILSILIIAFACFYFSTIIISYK